MANDFPIAAFLDALDEPAMLIEGTAVTSANASARALFGAGIEGNDIRLAIRHPRALEFILPGRDGDLELTGIGSLERPWQLRLRRVGKTLLFLQLIDRAAAHSAEKMRVDFVANASHELRTPLSVILGYAESLEDGAVDPKDCGRFGGVIRGEAKRMLRIIEDLMSLSRIEADRFVAATDRVAVAHVIRSAVDNNSAMAAKCGCHIHVQVEDGLPPVAGDYPQLLQLVDNLISNALRYACGDRDCTIEVSAAVERQQVRIIVRDNGPGIAREHLPRLTERFYRADPARSRDSGGTGLGLAIVKHIVERHRGLLAIDSIVGEGTTVTVRLPIARL
ncbi:MAG: ATP-binding protein [Pseudomonadota bacterium]|nr:ATP-binding protein [Sphingomonas sp.]MDQ3478508.1 ATP-binding protein [Pseudomonadota bacterium]